MHKCQCNDLITVSVSGLSAGKVPGICAAAVLLLCVIYLCIVKRKGEYYISDGKYFILIFFL